VVAFLAVVLLFPSSAAEVFCHHIVLVAVSAEEAHCDPNSLDHLVVSIYF
jgi:hypothetical protein